jgi:hypothetical protein
MADSRRYAALLTQVRIILVYLADDERYGWCFQWVGGSVLLKSTLFR